ncbi:hypothetical protein [Streptomyces sp. NBC_01794]|uniref:hypothetical protein n=1 Tax=Streptomyces sp. NBC_01794 TaxID=2975942 RepID=UPI0030879C78|nr:transposase family protein [Streptomyces sp. NBC_01794]
MPEEIPGLLERLAEVPDPRDPRGVRHALVVVLALRVPVSHFRDQARGLGWLCTRVAVLAHFPWTMHAE